MSEENKPKILIVDDEESIVKLIGIILGKEYELELFTNPLEAIDRICVNPANNRKPDLIITDLDLGQNCTGIKIIQYAREFFLEPDMPAIIMSAGFLAASEEDCLASTPHVITKPFDLAEFKALIKKILQNTNPVSHSTQA